MHLGVKKQNLKFYVDIFIYPKDIQVILFPIFLTVHIYLQLQVDNFCSVHSPNHKKFGSVEILKLSFRVLEIQAFIVIYF